MHARSLSVWVSFGFFGFLDLLQAIAIHCLAKINCFCKCVGVCIMCIFVHDDPQQTGVSSGMYSCLMLSFPAMESNPA